MSDKIKIIILAAGYGKRMKSELPKVLTPLNGRPLISYVLDAVKESEIDDRPVVVVGQQRELVINTLGDACAYAVQEEQLGTGHAVMSAQKILENSANHIVVLYGDHPRITAKTIKTLVERHLNSKSTLTMATVSLPDFRDWRENFLGFGRVVRDKNEKISKIVENKDATEEEKKILEVNPSYFCFDASWLWKNLKNLKTENAQKEYYLTDLVKIAMQEKINPIRSREGSQRTSTSNGIKIESINIEAKEALGVNSKEELAILEKINIK